jgi:hypothetical protein
MIIFEARRWVLAHGISDFTGLLVLQIYEEA